MELLIVALIFGSVALAAIALLPARAADLQARLGPYQYGGPLSERDVQLQQPLLSRVGLPLLRRLAALPARLAPQRAYEEAERLMETAGWTMDPNLFMGLRAAGMLGLPLLWLLVLGLPESILALGLIGLLGWFGGRLPVNWLRRKAAARQHKIQRALPDTLDLITVSVEAGLGLDA